MHYYVIYIYMSPAFGLQGADSLAAAKGIETEITARQLRQVTRVVSTAGGPP